MYVSISSISQSPIFQLCFKDLFNENFRRTYKTKINKFIIDDMMAKGLIIGISNYANRFPRKILGWDM